MTQSQEQYGALKKQILEGIFSRMNDMQRQAVFTVNGPLLILAGAGSGKTTVLINRVYQLVRFGDAYFSASMPDHVTPDDMDFLRRCAQGDCEDDARLDSLIACRPVRPWNILAITFTNKAAGELRERLSDRLGDVARDVNAATFHSACVRILRRNIDRLGYNSSFTIYDTDDSIRVIKKQMELQKVPDKNIKPRSILSAISRAKDGMTTPAQMLQDADGDYFSSLAAKIYAGYETELKKANAVDFDDIIVLTVRLFETCPDVLDYYQKRYRYIMVDEYQDTNQLQYRLISLLSAAHGNLCVVGDDDQSIYKFRGATIENILSFEEQFPRAAVIRLEQNYRSTKTILEAANKVISNNTERKGKNLWTQNDEGVKVEVHRSEDERGEAAHICDVISQQVRGGELFSSHAVLYRMNAQSSGLELEMTRRAIPYRIIGGLRFYDRKEIKDAIAYLSVVNNTSDNLRLTRIINEPKRGIGGATIESAARLAQAQNVSLYQVLREADQYADLSRKALSLLNFSKMMDEFIEDEQSGMPLDLLLDKILTRSGYLAALEAAGETEQTRVENLLELKTNVQRYIKEQEDGGGVPTLSGFLEEIALYTDIDSYNESDDRVVLMTIHSAKGLEFDHVFIAGAEDGIFPGNQSISSPAEMQEERRLCYVALTRARKSIRITCCAHRTLFGFTNRNPMSRFIKEIPRELFEFNDATVDRHVLSQAALSHVGGGQRAASKVSAKVTSAGVRAARGAVPALSAGDRVEHPMYGAGMVLSVKPMGGDQLLEIAFDTVGTKKVMANYARLQKMDG